MSSCNRAIRPAVSATCLIALVVLASCRSNNAPPLEQLLVGQDDLPGTWLVSDEGPRAPSGDAPLAEGYGALEALVVYFHHPAGDGSAGAHEQLFRFGTLSEAQDSYLRLTERSFRDGTSWRWGPPGSDVTPPPGASDSMLRCTRGRPEEMCRLVARYGMYLLDLKVDLFGLNSQMQPVRVLSYDGFRAVVDTVDERMSSAVLEQEN